MKGGEVTVLQQSDRQIIVEWKIKKFFDLFDEQLSPQFLFANENWCFHIYPNGDEGHFSEGCISLYLNRCNKVPLDDPRYTCVIGIKKSDGSVFESFSGDFTWVSENGWGVSNFLRRFKLLKYDNAVTPEGTLMVFATVSLKDGHGRLLSQALSSESLEVLTSNFKDLLHSGCHSDIKIKTGDREFQAHKCVLTVRSPVFTSMFEHNMAENNSGVVTISDCDPDSFEAFLNFLYTANVGVISPTNAISLYKMADKYDMKDLKQACCQWFKSKLWVDTVCDAIYVGVVHGESDLLAAATEFFIKNSSLILVTPRWKEFMVENPLVANELFIKTINSTKT